MPLVTLEPPTARSDHLASEVADRSPGVVHTDFATTDPQQAYDFLAALCGTGLEVSGLSRGDRLTASHDDLGPVGLRRVHTPARLRWSMDPLDKLVICRPMAGGHRRDSAGLHDQLMVGDIAILVSPHRPVRGTTEPGSNQTVSIELALLAEVAANEPGPARPVMGSSFRDCRPLSAADARRWCQVVRLAEQAVAVGSAEDYPLIRGQAVRLVAAAALSLFPNSLLADPMAVDRTDATSPTVRRAVAFIRARAGDDITVGEIAAAAHVTVRAVQLAFQAHLGTTPLRYLRQVRLERAHDDLRAAEPGQGQSVADIAARWGFFSPGRFSAAYRTTYGQSPSRTLDS